MIANEVIADMIKRRRFREALEEMASHKLTALGNPTVSLTCTAHLTNGPVTVRISIAMIPEGEMFPEDLAG